jgi:hypothetical protein
MRKFRYELVIVILVDIIATGITTITACIDSRNVRPA